MPGRRTTPPDRPACSLSARSLGHRGRTAMTLVEVLIALAVSALLLAAVATTVNSVVSICRTNQASLAGLSSARAAMDFIMSQVRRADRCDVVGPSQASGDATFPDQTSELSIVCGVGAARSDCDAGDYLEVHISTIDLGDGRTGLRLWKNSGSADWNGVSYSASDYFDIPGVTSAAILYAGSGTTARSVQLQLTIESDGQPGRTVQTTLTGSATVRR